jgi:hypothetical protein
MKTKDFVYTNKKNINSLTQKHQLPEIERKQSPRDKNEKSKLRQFMIRSPIDREKEKLQVQLDKIKKIILSNPYKYSNY